MPIRKDAWLQPRLKASLAEFEQRSCDNTLKWINHMATKQELSRYGSPLHTSHWSMLPPQTSLVFISWISTIFYPEIISSIIRYSIWVDVKGRLPVKITGNQTKQGILKPVEIDSFILGGTIRLLREFERNMMAHRANIAARHYIPPEWTVSVPAFSCFVFP